MPYVPVPTDSKPPRMPYPSDLSEAEWLLLEPLLPVRKTRGQARIHAYRDLVDGILYVLRGGNAWRALPHEYPPWQTTYTYFRDWSSDGTWKRVHDELCAAERAFAEREPEPTAGVLDSQTAKTTERGATEATTGARRSSGASATCSWTPTAA